MFVRWLCVGLLIGCAMTAQARTPIATDDTIMPTGDRWVPFPKNRTQPMPWSDIQGLWKVEEKDFVSYFSFRVVNDRAGGYKKVQIKQFEGDTCRVISHGVGLEKERKFMIGQVVSSSSGKRYRIQVSAFLEHDFPLPVKRSEKPTDELLLLSIGNTEDKFPEEMVHVQIVKISESISQTSCFADVRQ